MQKFFFLLKISTMVRSVEEIDTQLILYSNYSRHQKLNYQTRYTAQKPHISLRIHT